uniref:Uncharacterized protein n=1 Tax=Panagrolaimus davidi TaxID=227884 RepID=A0A914PBG2_9BILA
MIKIIIPYSKDYLQSKFIKINGHTAFLELLSSENCSIRFKAASLLNKIDSDIKIPDVYKPEGPVFKTEKVFDVNKISNLSAFFEYMKNPSHVLQHSACCCLNAFLSEIEGRSAFRKLFFELNTQINVTPLVALLSSPKIKVQKAAIILVDALVCAYSGNKKQFLQAGALRALVLQLQYPKRRKLAAAGIHNFSKNVVQADTISTHRTESIQKIIKFLIQILRRKDSETFECALIALKNFVLEPCNRDFCIHAGILDPLIKAIQNEPPNQLFIHRLPWFLSTLYESGDSILSNKKIVSTIPAMKTLLHVNDQDIIRASILAMWTLGKKFESRFVQCLGTFVSFFLNLK